MDKFTASNGTKVLPLKSGALGFQLPDSNIPSVFALTQQKVQALREFFLAERDEQLGRRRDLHDPHYVCYPVDGGETVRVIDERDGSSLWLNRLVTDESTGSHAAAFRFFEAHPERKPWEDAKHGEVWLVSIDGAPETPMTVEHEACDFPRFIEPIEHLAYGPKSGITAARRIWPEGDAS